MSAPVILVLGAGANVGQAVCKKFAAQGWKVAAVARTVRDEITANSALALSADFSEPDSIPGIFKEVETKLGTPSVVVYNAYFTTFGASADPLAASVADFAKAMAVNTTSAFVAAKLGLEGFKKLPSSAPKVFIYTGNMESSLIVPEVMVLGSGKNASLYFLETAAYAYGKEGSYFYFADERMSDGTPVMNKIDGDVHAEEYWVLANAKEQRAVNYTFAKGKGYLKFDIDRNRDARTAAELIKEVAEKYGSN